MPFATRGHRKDDVKTHRAKMVFYPPSELLEAFVSQPSEGINTNDMSISDLKAKCL